MDPIRRFAAPLVVVAVLSGASGACTPNDEGNASENGGTTPPPTAASGSPTAVLPTGSGVYVYENLGLVATLDLGDGTGTLEIENGTGHDLPEPDFYILDARDGHRVEGTVEAPADIPDGESATFDVRFEGIEVRNIGLVILLLGPDNYGAFVPQ
jgi:hypothetical protein